MKTKRYLKGMIAALAISGMCWQTLAVAAENVQPSYTNAATAEHAAHMARQETNTTDPSLQAALDDVHAAETQMNSIQGSGNQGLMMTAETNLNNAEDRYVGMLSRMTGVSEKEIGDMHASGTSWSEIAGELGMQMSQGAMGTPQNGNVGSMMNSRSAEIMGSTARNTESGWAEGHGTGITTGGHGTDSGGMMSGAGGLGNGMDGSSDMGGGSGMGSEGGMGGSSSGGSSSGGSSGGMGASGGSGGGTSGGGGGMGGSGGSGGSGGGGMGGGGSAGGGGMM